MIKRRQAQVFNLSFLTPEFYSPAVSAAEGLDSVFLHQHALVPMDRFGDLLTVAMPALTPTQVLAQLSEKEKVEEKEK